MKKHVKKGFTLVELLVVMAIIAILATVSVVGYTSFVAKAKLSKAQTELAQVRDYIYAAEVGNAEISLTDAKLKAYLREMGYSEDEALQFGVSGTDIIVYRYDDAHTVSVRVTDSEFYTDEHTVATESEAIGTTAPQQ